MRTKSGGVKPRFAKSRQKPPSSATLRPFPLVNPDDDDDDDDFSKRSGRSTDDCNVADGDDWMEVEACLICNGRGELLVCCVIDCPVSVHEKCAKFKLTFDDLGRFYCPYCSYKREVARAKELMKQAVLAKKVLSGFIDSELVAGEPSGGRERRDNGKSVEFDGAEQQAQMEEYCRDNGKGLEVDDAEQQAQMEDGCRDNGNGLEYDDAEQQAQMEEDCREDVKGVEFGGAEQQAQMEDGCRDNGKGLEFDDAEQEAQMEKDCRGNEMDDALRGAKPSKKAPSQLHTTAEKEAKNENKTVTPPKKSRQRWEFPKAPRQRLRWTSEEEDMLKEGVEKFAKPGQKNIPWKKILDFGRQVFDSTRTPTDLKEKWRRI
ncbi:unnamed protein product [Dovyalis caffra]|uniref:Myb-like domain-containing protein n=1 Tax=Dovyalis caffra TaxID=77055 RepID=A0AAV1S787_9ROSI|nr:unnamed protein product [Dovyalis caffra]